jgi:signal transduction histidine kinase
VDDMLDISRLSTGRLTLQKEKFDLVSLTSEVIERLRPHLEEAKCEVIFTAGEKFEGQWDRFRIDQVLTNLLTNAAKYAPGKPIEVEITQGAGEAIIRVKDQGKGIAPKDHERIFQRFERSESSQDVRGMGLGLFIVKEIVDMHQGRIQVISDLGKGAEFVVRLPN